MVLLAMLKADSNGTDVAGTTKRSRAIREKVGYFATNPSTNLLRQALQFELGLHPNIYQVTYFS
jgi:hypothetical protein